MKSIVTKDIAKSKLPRLIMHKRTNCIVLQISCNSGVVVNPGASSCDIGSNETSLYLDYWEVFDGIVTLSNN